MTKDTIHKDILIIGAGMAGLTAALYAGRLNASVLVLETASLAARLPMPQASKLPGLSRISGHDLIAHVQEQAEHFGAVIDEFDAIESVTLTATPKRVETTEHIYEADAIIIASGMNRRLLPLPEERKYASKGVHYCEFCDGHLYQGKTIAVMGGGNAAVDAANFLTKYAKHLYLVHRSQLRADDVSIERFKGHDNVTIMLQTEIKALHGDGRLSSIDLFHTDTGTAETLPVDGIFVNIGVVPNTQLLKGSSPSMKGVFLLEKIAGQKYQVSLPPATYEKRNTPAYNGRLRRHDSGPFSGKISRTAGPVQEITY